jgi:hypothetical protein
MESGTQLINVRSLGAKLKIVISRCKRRRFEPLFIAFYLISGTGFAGNVQLPTMPSREATISWPTILTLLEDRSERAPLSGDTNAQTEAILWLHKSQRRPRTKEEKKGRTIKRGEAEDAGDREEEENRKKGEKQKKTEGEEEENREDRTGGREEQTQTDTNEQRIDRQETRREKTSSGLS